MAGCLLIARVEAEIQIYKQWCWVCAFLFIYCKHNCWKRLNEGGVLGMKTINKNSCSFGVRFLETWLCSLLFTTKHLWPVVLSEMSWKKTRTYKVYIVHILNAFQSGKWTASFLQTSPEDGIVVMIRSCHADLNWSRHTAAPYRYWWGGTSMRHHVCRNESNAAPLLSS